MSTISDYLNLSIKSQSVNSYIVNPNEFADILKSVPFDEQVSCLRHFVVLNTPYVFRQTPILFEQLIKYLADRLQVNLDDVKLIGSAKTGFSISPLPNYGKAFDKGDLDFAISNSILFDKLKAEFDILVTKHNLDGLGLTPTNAYYWEENINLIPRTINRGFIDCNKIPLISPAPLARYIADILWLIQEKLKEINGIEVKKPSLRVYKDSKAFINVLRYNTFSVLNEL